MSEDKDGPAESDSVKEWDSVDEEEGGVEGGKMAVAGGSGGGGSGSISLNRFGNLWWVRRVRRSDSGKASSSSDPVDSEPRL